LVPRLIFILEFSRVFAQVVELRPRCFDELEAAFADRAQRRPSKAQGIIRLTKDHPVDFFCPREVRTERAFGQVRRRSNAEQIKNRGEDVGRLYLRLNHLHLLRDGRLHSFSAHWQLDEQGHMSRRIVEEDTMGLLAVFSESFAMITRPR
jgi:hypothetical protein